ncbi:MAG: D-tyrosyl-tRNA(Tyr) deacylase [Clostridia bacterium]|nr:D-tyrosyl-tRNA(Tyr) deacylase [Clostridia bacterium]
MRAVVTRVTSASVEIEGKIHGSIGKGFLVLLGVSPTDTQKHAEWMADRIAGCRVFEDEQGKMNLSLSQVGGDILAVSQFTLYADLKSRRPGFTSAARPDIAEPLYEHFMKTLEDKGFTVERGVFGADMKVASLNDGPVTLIFDSENQKI